MGAYRSKTYWVLGMAALGAVLTALACGASSPTPEGAVSPLPVGTVLPTTRPTATAVAPTATPSLPAATSEPQPTPRPVATATPSAPELSVGPDVPKAGALLAFSIRRVRPGERFALTYRSPSGKAAAASSDVTAGQDGSASWSRSTTLDDEGQWTVSVRGDQGDTLQVSYVLQQLQLDMQTVKKLNAQFRRYQGQSSDVYISPGIHTYTALEMSSVVRRLMDRIATEIGAPPLAYPPLYLFRTPEAAASYLKQAGFNEQLLGGLYIREGPNAGVYLVVNLDDASLYHILAHELTHQMVYWKTGGAELSTWLSEGIAEDYGLKAAREELANGGLDASSLDLAEQQDRNRVRKANQEQGLVLITQAENAGFWTQATTETAYLFYAQYRLFVQYLSNQYGARFNDRLLEQLKLGVSSAQAIERVAGKPQETLFGEFSQWVAQGMP